MSLKSDIIKYTSKPLLGAGAIYLYDVMIENQYYKSNKALYDSLLFGGSVFISKL